MTYEILKRMNKEKYNTILCALYHPGPMGEVFQSDGYRIYSRVIRSKYDIRAYYRLRNIIHENRIDVIYVINQPLTLFWGYLISRTMKIPIISVIYNTFESKRRLKFLIYKAILPHVDKVIAVAQKHKEYLIRKENVPEHLIEVIYNAVNYDKLVASTDEDTVIKSLGIGSADKVVGIVSRLVHLKGIDIFIEAAKLVLQKMQRVHFLIIGDGPERAHLQNLVVEMQLDKKVFILGPREDLADLLSIFNIGVLASRTEALPLVVLEYMAVGIPTVATNVGSVSEIVHHMENGILVEPENPQMLADSIMYLLENDKEAARMASNAKKLVRMNYKLDVSVKQTEAIIEEVVAPWKITSLTDRR